MDKTNLIIKLERNSVVSSTRSYNDVPCREWQRGRRTKRLTDGSYVKTYGHINVPNGDGTFDGWATHRLSLFLEAEFDLDLHVCHRCDNPICIEPEHLFVGTHGDNMADKKAKGRANNEKLRGTGSYSNILSEADVLSIRQKVADKEETQLALSILYGVSTSAIQDIVKRRTWKWL